MKLSESLSELVDANVISDEIAQKIQLYYNYKKHQKPNRLFLLFAVLGTLLIGLGLVLIVAHNWDNLQTVTKTSIAFAILLITQIFGAFVLIKYKHIAAYREGASGLLFFAVGATISLVSQIYHIEGNLDAFILTWMLLCLPLVYIFKASLPSLLYLAGITYFAFVHVFTFDENIYSALWYWPLLLGVLPHYWYLLKSKEVTNAAVYHHWAIACSLIIATATTFSYEHTFYMFPLLFMALFAFLYEVGLLPPFDTNSHSQNAFRKLGYLGAVVLLYIFSFENYFSDIKIDWIEFAGTNKFVAFFFFLTMSLGLFLLSSKPLFSSGYKPVVPIFLVFFVLFILGFYTALATVLINLLVLFLGILEMKYGAKENNLSKLNRGFLMVSLLILIRFFDEDLSFVVRGLLFLLVGVGFVLTNYFMLKKRRSNEQ